jgi:ATP-dependent Clp protease ATP-binding subunit ClpA
VFERFTEKAIKVIMLAQEEARRLGHNFVGTEFVLLGLIGEGTGIAAKTLKSMGVNLKDARKEVEKIVGRGNGFVAVEIPFTPNGKRQLELAWEEARSLGHDYIGTEHLLLALIRLEESTGLKVLGNLGVDTTKVRTRLIRLLSEVSAGKANARPGVKFDPIENEVNKTLFEAIVSALPAGIRPIVLELREIVCDKEDAIQSADHNTAEHLGIREAELLAELSEQTEESPEVRKIMLELQAVRREKENAIKRMDFENAASIREKEIELSEKLEELKNRE